LLDYNGLERSAPVERTNPCRSDIGEWFTPGAPTSTYRYAAASEGSASEGSAGYDCMALLAMAPVPHLVDWKL